MRTIALFSTLALAVFALPGSHLIAQSHHANAMARSFKDSHPDYVEDILVSKPDLIVFAPEQRMALCGDTYNDHFQVFDKPDGTLFAAWKQATREGFADHHIMFSRSNDKGLTWSKPKARLLLC